jgi:hypothetical protein
VLLGNRRGVHSIRLTADVENQLRGLGQDSRQMLIVDSASPESSQSDTIKDNAAQAVADLRREARVVSPATTTDSQRHRSPGRHQTGHRERAAEDKAHPDQLRDAGEIVAMVGTASATPCRPPPTSESRSAPVRMWRRRPAD